MKKNLITALWVTAIIWIVFLVNFIFFFYDFNNLGIKPKTTEGLIGIVLSPFLHANWGHLISNSIPLFLLTFIILQFYNKLWIPVSIFSILLGGFMVWLLSASTTTINGMEVRVTHIGASGVIFSYIGFLLFSGIFRRSFKSILIGVIILVLYGGALLRGIMPGQEGISWQGHLFGAIAGVLAAYLYRNKYKKEEKTKLL